MSATVLQFSPATTNRVDVIPRFSAASSWLHFIVPFPADSLAAKDILMLRKSWKQRRLLAAQAKQLRLRQRQRMWMMERLEERAAPGSMLVDVLTESGHSVAGAEQVARAVAAGESREAANKATTQTVASRNGLQLSNVEQPAENSDLRAARREFQRSRRDVERSNAAPRQPDNSVRDRDRTVDNRSPQSEARSRSASTEVTASLSTDLDAPLDELLGFEFTAQSDSLNKAEAPLPRGLGSSSQSSQSPEPALDTHRESPWATRPAGDRSNSGSGFSSKFDQAPSLNSGYPGFSPSLSSSLPADGASASASVDVVTTAGSSHQTAPVAVDRVSGNESTSSPAPSAAFTTRLGFSDGLVGWTTREMGGSNTGRGTVTAGSAVLREGDSFLVTIEREFLVADDALSLSFTYEAYFDTTDPELIKDAFEAALLDSDGFSLTSTFRADRDSYYNVTEGLPPALGAGATVEEIDHAGAQSGRANRVTLDVRDVPDGSESLLVFRLVNNDSDTQTYVRIFDVELTRIQSSSISGFVYADVNNNGVKDAGELGLPGVTITLDGPVERTILTGADGSYHFDALPDGVYSVSQTQPPGYLDGLDTPGQPVLGSVENDRFFDLNLSNNVSLVDYNFGERIIPVSSNSISGFVYADVNNNGVKDAVELPLPNVPITISGPVARMIFTAADGSYRFDDLPAGTYTITETQPAAFLDGQDTQGTPTLGSVANDQFYSIDLTSDIHATGYNFGERGLRAELISKQLYLASSPNGQQLVTSIMAGKGANWYRFAADAEGSFVATVGSLSRGSRLELYSANFQPVAITCNQDTLVAQVMQGENYVLHVATEASSSPIRANLSITPNRLVPGNAPFAIDVNGDGWVSPVDALRVINYLNGPGTSNSELTDATRPLDVDRNGVVSPRDALIIVNYLNGPGTPEAEGDPSPVDLTISNLDTTELVYDGQTLTVAGTISAKITNRWTGEVDHPFEVVFFEDLDGDEVYSAGVDRTLGSVTISEPMSRGESRTISATISSEVQFVENAIWAMVDAQDAIAEKYETNNLTRTTSALSEVIDSQVADQPWGTVAVDSSTPESSADVLPVRVADGRSLVNATPWTSVPSSEPLHSLGRRFLEVQVRPVGSEATSTPRVEELTVAAIAPPTITVHGPADGTTLSAGQQIVLSGTAIATTQVGPGPPTTVPNRITAVLVNGRAVDAIDAAGNFFMQATIVPGDNLFEVMAIDAYGQRSIQTLRVVGDTAADVVAENLLFDVSPSFVAAYARTSFDERTDLLHAQLAIENVGQYSVDNPFYVGVRDISDPTVTIIGATGRTKDGMPYYNFSEQVPGSSFDASEITGFVHATFHNPSREPFTYELVYLATLNEPPAFTSVPLLQAYLGHAYDYDADAADPDGDALTYALISAPRSMTIVPETGAIAWTATEADRGLQLVVVRVEDGRGGAAEQRFAINVSDLPPNRPPVITSVPVTETTLAVSSIPLYEYDVEATDFDSDPVEFVLTESPVGMQIDSKSGLITWTPTTAQLGPHVVTVEARDGRGGIDQQSYVVEVAPDPQNHPPVIVSEPAVLSVSAGSYLYRVQSIDPDGDTLTYQLTSHPMAMSIESGSGMIHWDTANVEAGDYPVSILVTDGRGGFDSQTFELRLIHESGTVTGTIYEDLNQNGWRDSELISGEAPLVVFVVDVSGSMSDVFGGTKTGDRNNDGKENTRLDAVVGAFELFHQRLIDLGLGDTASLALVTFNHSRTVFDFNLDPIVTDVKWSLAGPSGKLVSNQRLDRSDSSNGFSMLDLPPGVYNLSMTAGGSEVADYVFRLVDLSSASPLVLGASIVGALDPGMETDLYQFTAEAGERVYFQMESLGGGTTNGRWRLVDPHGQVLFTQSLSSDVDTLQLEQAGTYTLLLEGQIGEPFPRDYTFTVHSVAYLSQDLTLDTDTLGTLSKPGEQDLYQFTLSESTRVYFDALTNDSGL
ncbi:MAG: hypothetical protein GXY58_05455, partial [Planctomycetaceae bacterium]|nr:hypothetical protein [Planctomycetaceae bacterium]